MLQTDWLKVATAGRTVDGREIKPEWLEKVAAAYSPKVYTASVNSEHFFYPGLGYVTGLRAAQDEEGRTALYAKVAPTAELLARYQNRRQLFFSMELRPDFPAKGDLYLTGLAITDIPASQGLEPARFLAGAEARERFFDTARLETGEQMPGGGAEPARAPEPAGDDTPPGWWSALWESLRPHLGRRTDDNAQEQSDAMTNEERQAFQALQEQVAGLKTELGELTEKLSAQALPEIEPEAEDATDPAAEAMERFTAELQAKLTEAVQPLAERIGKLEAYLAEPVEGERGEVIAPVGATGEGFVF